ncbi:DEAD/DEAH box helicase [Candidatus Entotheonella palauensis]|uniref:Helicase n=1 Tax=Candidatus Entotheonella gemina TaxID=1429439 RepID=W4MB08_9BACT|nr:DEAD/DEAH box helicase [Candidatus Entotheonella palauensis]ETX07355.1 MAG: helicase [Candidatus Entotheonella gemina]
MQALFEEIRENCSPTIWSRGVELSRAGAVVTEASDDEEITLKVATRQVMAYATVTLWPEEEDWLCDCKSTDPACAHVAAAVIALRQAKSKGMAATQPKMAPGKIGYRLKREDRAIALERMVVQQETTRPLTHSLEAIASGRVDGPAVMIAQPDLVVEQALGRRYNGPIPRERMSKLLGALAQCHDVRLDDQPIKTSSKEVLPQACVEDRGDGFALFLEPDPSIREVFKNGVVLCGETLRPVGQSGLSAREREELQGPDGRYFSAGDVAELVTDIIPSLRKRVTVDVRTSRLPSTQAEPPRLQITTRREGDMLVVEPQLIYGEPPTARIEDDRLIPLGRGALPIRDTKTEQRLTRQLQHHLKLVPGKALQVTGAQAVDLAARLKTWPGGVRGAGHETFFLAPPLRPRLQLDAAHFNLDFESDTASGGRSPGGRVPANAVLRAWQDNAALIPLQGGGWAPLPVDWLQQFGHHVADLLVARNAANELPASALPDLARLCDALDEPRPPELAGLQTLLDNFSGIPDAELAADLQATLRPYQRAGVNWLVFLRQAGLGAMLADDMGLGKTLQALCAVHGRTLVVAPTSVLHNWAEEIRRFRPALRCAIYHGPQRRLEPQADVTLTTYAILRLDIGTLASQPWDTVILDEAQNIKNPESQVAQAAYQLQSGFRLTLSGTPIENRLDELWSQFHFLNRGLLGGIQHFQERYVKAITHGQPGAAERLRERLRPFILRRRKQEVATELPPRTEVVLRCVLTEDEHDVYNAIQAATREDVIKRLAAGGSVLEALEALLRLRQAACHTGLVPGHEAPASSKVDLLIETLDQVIADGHKALVFSQWTALLDRVEPHLRDVGMDFVRLDGTTRDRAGVVQHFQSDDGPPVMLISLRAGGVGLNLTAADHVFLLDPWWNPAVEDQAADRAHRIGQERPVLVTRLVAQDTVEERILALQQQKRLLAESVLDGAEQATALTREDLLALLA